MPNIESTSTRRLKGDVKLVEEASYLTFIYTPIQAIILLCNMILIILVLGLLLFVTIYINKNYHSFQENLSKSKALQETLLLTMNGLITLINISQALFQTFLDVWNLCVPFVNLLVTLFFKAIIGVMLVISGNGVDNSKSKTSFRGDKYESVDPSTFDDDSLSQEFLDLIQCILINVMQIFSGVFRSLMRGAGEILLSLIKWLDDNLQRRRHRNEYCRSGSSSPLDDSSHQNPNDPNQKIYDDGTGPGGICPDMTELVQSVISIATSIIEVATEVIVAVIPIVASFLKMIFDTVLKILPQLMKIVVFIIKIFAPEQPLGKMLAFILNTFIKILDFFIQSCVLQLITSTWLCLFNIAVALVMNIIIGIIDVIVNIVCFRGLFCDTSTMDNAYLPFPSCDWSSFTSCVNKSYDDKSQDVSGICQIESLGNMLKNKMYEPHMRMSSKRDSFAKEEDYVLEYHEKCLDTYAKEYYEGEDTVKGHLFCMYLSQHVHDRLTENGVIRRDPFVENTELHDDIRNSCLCKYTSPICESETCALSYYHILIHQILNDMNVGTCKEYEKEKHLVRAYCLSRVWSSLQLTSKDLPGTNVHCEGLEKLLEENCKGKNENETNIDIRPIVGGMSKWIDETGYCDDFRRPSKMNEELQEMTMAYNSHIKNIKERRKLYFDNSRRTGSRRDIRKVSFNIDDRSYHTDIFDFLSNQIQDHFDVAYYVASRSFPMLSSMILNGNHMEYQVDMNYSRDIDLNMRTLDGRLRHVRVDDHQKWKDYDGKSLMGMKSKHVNGNWHMKTTESGDWHILSVDSSCSQTDGKGYVNGQSFSCTNGKISGTADNTGGVINSYVSKGNVKDQFADTKSKQSDQVETKTLTNDRFESASRYVDLMYNYNITSDASFTSEDAKTPNLDPNWRTPLTEKDTSNGQQSPPVFDIYGNDYSNNVQSKEKCPMSENFPFEKVFKKRKTFLTPVQAFLEQIPRYSEIILDEIKGVEIPNHAYKTSRNVIRMKKNSFTKNIKNAFQMSEQVGTALSDIYVSIEKMKNMYSGEEEHLLKRENNQNGEKRNTWKEKLKGGQMGVNPNPQKGNNGETDLCVSRLLNPYECCTANSTAYECCFGLIGCIKPPKVIHFNYIKNLDWLLNAQCSGGGNVFMSMMLIPRLFLGGFLWTLIMVSPPWLRPLMFDTLYPFIYDYGGKGKATNLWGDIFCFIINLYYWVLIALGFIALCLLNNTVISVYKQLRNTQRINKVGKQISTLKEELDDLRREIYEKDTRNTSGVDIDYLEDSTLRYRK